MTLQLTSYFIEENETQLEQQQQKTAKPQANRVAHK